MCVHVLMSPLIIVRRNMLYMCSHLSFKVSGVRMYNASLPDLQDKSWWVAPSIHTYDL